MMMVMAQRQRMTKELIAVKIGVRACETGCEDDPVPGSSRRGLIDVTCLTIAAPLSLFFIFVSLLPVMITAAPYHATPPSPSLSYPVLWSHYHTDK